MVDGMHFGWVCGDYELKVFKIKVFDSIVYTDPATTGDRSYVS